MTPDRCWRSDLTLTVVARACLPIGQVEPVPSRP